MTFSSNGGVTGNRDVTEVQRKCNKSATETRPERYVPSLLCYSLLLLRGDFSILSFFLSFFLYGLCISNVQLVLDLLSTTMLNRQN
jgi:hypothetical protein